MSAQQMLWLLQQLEMVVSLAQQQQQQVWIGRCQ